MRTSIIRLLAAGGKSVLIHAAGLTQSYSLVVPLSQGEEGAILARGEGNGNLVWMDPLSLPSAGPGPKGDTGLQGIPGTQGAAGPIGETGATGLQGLQGATGNVGPPGINGLPGSSGATGAKGDKGDIGLTGSVGPKGDQGLVGLTGPPGATGGQGIQGIQGLTGIDGIQGPQGIQGLTGLGYDTISDILPINPINGHLWLEKNGNLILGSWVWNSALRAWLTIDYLAAVPPAALNLSGVSSRAITFNRLNCRGMLFESVILRVATSGAAHSATAFFNFPVNALSFSGSNLNVATLDTKTLAGAGQVSTIIAVPTTNKAILNANCMYLDIPITRTGNPASINYELSVQVRGIR